MSGLDNMYIGYCCKTHSLLCMCVLAWNTLFNWTLKDIWHSIGLPKSPSKLFTFLREKKYRLWVTAQLGFTQKK